MSLTVYEKAGSPRAKFVNATTNNGSSIEFTYVVLGTSSEIDAANGALAVAPLAYLVNSETLVRQEATPTPTGPDSWEVTVRYGTEDEQQSQQPPQPGTWHFNFDTSGGTHKITQSLQTLWRGERSQTNPAPDLLGATNRQFEERHCPLMWLVPTRPEPARLAAAIGEAYAGRSDPRVAHARDIATRDYSASVMGRRWLDLCQHVLHGRLV